MGQHKQKKLRGGTICTADEYKRIAPPKPETMSKAEVDRLIANEIERRFPIFRLVKWFNTRGVHYE